MSSLLHCPQEIVGATLAVALTLTGQSRTIHTHKLKLVRRSLDSLRSLGMTAGVERWIESAYL